MATASRSPRPVHRGPATLTCLHTAAVHVERFDAIAARAGLPLALRHLVEPELLNLWSRGKIEPVEAEVDRILADANPDDEVILCTCSSIAGTAEAAAGRFGLRATRVDRPMIETAVNGYDRITVLATTQGTIQPTMALLADVAARAGRSVHTHALLVDGAWRAFKAGDIETYEALIADTANSVADDGALVFAQVSMADAALRCDPHRRVLTSPLSGFLAAARLCLGERVVAACDVQ